MSLPLIQTVRGLYHDARISVLAKPALIGLLGLFPSADELIPWDNNGTFRKLRDTSGILRNKRFDMAIILPNSFSSGLLCFLSNIPKRVGYARDGRSLLLTGPVRFTGELLDYHHTDYYLNLLGNAGMNGFSSLPGLTINEEQLSNAKEFLRQTGCSLRGKLLGISPGAVYGPAKRWQSGNFAEVGKIAVNETGSEVVVFGSKEEGVLAEKIVNYIGRNAFNLAGETSLKELAGILTCCNLLLTNDTGTMHLAAAVGTKVAAIFGSTDPLRTAPIGEHIIIRKEFACAPCFQRVCPKKNDSIGNYMLSKKSIRGKDSFPLSAECDIHAEGIGTLGKNHQGFSLKGKYPNKVRIFLDCMEAVTPEEVWERIKQELL
jgi:heptosyltransferase-2